MLLIKFKINCALQHLQHLLNFSFALIKFLRKWIILYHSMPFHNWRRNFLYTNKLVSLSLSNIGLYAVNIIELCAEKVLLFIYLYHFYSLLISNELFSAITWQGYKEKLTFFFGMENKIKSLLCLWGVNFGTQYESS